ncbi:unnamed protein product [Rhodiola kirilowii]
MSIRTIHLLSELLGRNEQKELLYKALDGCGWAITKSHRSLSLKPPQIRFGEEEEAEGYVK